MSENNEVGVEPIRKTKTMWLAIFIGSIFLIMQILLAIFYREPPIAEPFTVLLWPLTIIGLFLSVMPSIMFSKYGGVGKGRGLTHTTKLVDKGVYALIRHPQYASGIWISTALIFYNQSLLSFICTIFVTISFEICMNDEDKTLISKFGEQYIDYMERTAQASLVKGTLSYIKAKSK